MTYVIAGLVEVYDRRNKFSHPAAAGRPFKTRKLEARATSSDFLPQLLQGEALRRAMALFPILQGARRDPQFHRAGDLRKLVPLPPRAHHFRQ